jgi:hypothetical protein
MLVSMWQPMGWGFFQFFFLFWLRFFGQKTQKRARRKAGSVSSLGWQMLLR